MVGERWKSIARSRWAKASGWLGGRFGEEAEDAFGLLLVAALAGQRGEAQQAHRRGAVAGGDRVVADLLAAGDQRFVVVGGGEEAAALVVAEAGDHRLGELAGPLEPALLEGRFVEGEQRLEQEGVVLEVGVEVGAAVLVGAQQVAVGVAQLRPDELGAGAGGVQVVLALRGRRPASARAAIISAFQEARRLSSSPGQTRLARAS